MAGLGFRVQDSGLRFGGFRVQGSGLRVQDSGLGIRVQDSGSRYGVLGSGFQHSLGRT